MAFSSFVKFFRQKKMRCFPAIILRREIFRTDEPTQDVPNHEKQSKNAIF
jgi:hypothetical protein